MFTVSCLIFIFFLQLFHTINNNKSVVFQFFNQLSNFSLNNQKGVKKNSFRYILRLLAGKSRAICTEFPLITSSTKNSKWFPLNTPSKHVNITLCKTISYKNCEIALRSNFSSKFLRNSSLTEVFQCLKSFAQGDAYTFLLER